MYFRFLPLLCSHQILLAGTDAPLQCSQAGRYLPCAVQTDSGFTYVLSQQKRQREPHPLDPRPSAFFLLASQLGGTHMSIINRKIENQ